MTREINYRFLLLLLALLAAGTAVTLAVHAGQVRHHARLLMAQAQQAEDEGRLPDAMRALRRYLVFAPEDNSTRAHYGEIVEKMASSDPERWQAVEVYEQVLYREPTRQDIRRRLARLTLSLGWTREARAQLEILVRQQPNEGEFHGLLGQCQEKAGEYTQAALSYERAFREDPRQIEAYVRLALLLQDRLDQPERAEQVLDELVSKNSQSTEAYLARAMHRLNRGWLAKAGSDLEHARRLAGDDPRILLALADLEGRRGRRQEARRWLLQGRTRAPRHLAVHLALATLERQCHRPHEAAACLREGLRTLPDQPDLLLLLGETVLDMGDESALQSVIERLQRPGMPSGWAHYLKGSLQLHRQQWSEAIHTLQEVVQSPDSSSVLVCRANLVLARCHEQRGDSTRQLAALRQAVERDGTSVLARMALAAALEHRGNLEQALEQYRQLVTMGPAPEENWLRLGRLLLQRNRSLPGEKRRWSEIDEVLERAARYPTLELSLTVLRAEVLLEQGRAEPARTLLEKTAADHPSALEPWMGLIDLALRQGDLTRALQALEKARQKLGTHRELCEAEITLALRQRARQATQTLRKVDDERNRLPENEQAALLKQLAAAYFHIGEPEEGRRLCRILAERTPAELASRLALLDLAVLGSEENLLAQVTTDLRRLEGEDGIWWRYAEATRLVLKAERGATDDRRDAGPLIERARARVADLVRRRPDWPRGALLEASLHELEGEPVAAAKAYLRGFGGGERFPGLTERLAGLLVEQGRLDEADEVIRRFEQQTPPSAELARLGAEIALRMRNTERAREQARLAVPKGTGDYQQLIWLGQVLGQAGRPAEGEEALRQAVHLRGDLAETWLALIAHLVRIEQDSDAEDVREEMSHRLPAEQVPLALAVAYEVLAQWQRAEEQYRRALARTPDDVLVLQRAASFFVRLNRVEQAEPLLRRLLATDVPNVNQAWARRQLALLLAFSGGAEKYREALALLPTKGHPKEESLLDRRARLLVEGTRPEARRDMLRRLEETSKQHPFLPEELFCLARLYEAEKNTQAARERLLDLLALEPRNPEYLAHHIDRLLKQGRPAEAWPFLKRLQRLEPDSPRLQRFKRATVSDQQG